MRTRWRAYTRFTYVTDSTTGDLLMRTRGSLSRQTRHTSTVVIYAFADAIATLAIYENKFHYYPPSYVGWVADKDAEFDKFIGL